MSDFFSWARDLTLLSSLLRLLLAALLGGLIGTERGRRGRAAGMRTHILVSIGAVLTTLVGLYSVQILGFAADPLRVGAQVISGIGFLGVGTILVRDRFHVTGLTTAAGLWATAAIGLAIGIGLYEPALLAVLLVLAANAILPKMERTVQAAAMVRYIYAELTDIGRINDFESLLGREYHMEGIRIVPARSGITGNVGIEAELRSPQAEELAQACRSLSSTDYVAFAVEFSSQEPG